MGGVYKRVDWNDLITEVNDLGSSPPEDCGDPLSPLDLVGPNHIWTKQDIEEVRDRLMEICPTNEFTEELRLWKQAVVDELEAAIVAGWCGCIETEVIDHGLLCHQPVEAHCREEPNSGSQPCNFCSGDCEVWYNTGTWYPPPATCDYLSMYAVYRIALDAYYEVRDAVDTCNRQADIIEWQQGLIDGHVADLDEAIANYNTHGCATPIPEEEVYCANISATIQAIGTHIQTHQAQLDIVYAEFVTAYDKIAPNIIVCDDAATDLMALQLACTVRHPGVDFNPPEWVYPILFDKNYTWWKWFNPYTDHTIVPERVRPTIVIRHTVYPHDGGDPGTNIVNVNPYFSPNGTPFTLPMGQIFLALAWMTQVLDTKCDAILEVSCEPYGLCAQLPTQYTLKPHGYNTACVGNDSMAWWLDPAEHDCHDYQITIRYNPSKIGKDYTIEQTEYYNTYLNWYTEHPTYDNRHEGY